MELASSIVKLCNGISQTLKSANEMLALSSDLISKLNESLSSIEKIAGGAPEP